MDEENLFPFGHEFQHVLREMIAFQLVAVQVGSEPVGHAADAGHESADVDAVVVEVCGKVEISAVGEVGFQEVDKPGVDQPPFPVLFFRPGIGAVDMYTA